jgi:hypothetical protein
VQTAENTKSSRFSRGCGAISHSDVLVIAFFLVVVIISFNQIFSVIIIVIVNQTFLVTVIISFSPIFTVII